MVARHASAPRGTQPLFFRLAERQQAADARIDQIQGRQLLQRIDHLQADVVEVTALNGIDDPRPQQQRNDSLRSALIDVGQTSAETLGIHFLCDRADFLLRHLQEEPIQRIAEQEVGLVVGRVHEVV